MAQKEVQTLEQPGTSVITSDGVLTGIEKYSEKKQKAIIVSEVASNANEIVKTAEDVEEAKLKIKTIRNQLKRSKEFKDLINLKAEIKALKSKGVQLSTERSGMLRLAKKLGYDVSAEIQNIKKISQ